MNFNHLIFSSPHQSSICRNSSPKWQRNHQQEIHFSKSREFSSFNSALFGCGFSYPKLECQKQPYIWKFAEVKNKKLVIAKLGNNPVKISRKKGSIAGAVALIIGTSIGTGILALPKKTFPAGIVPSSITMTLCWAFLLIEALLLVEINVALQRKKNVKGESDELEVMSIRTMAQETLGEWGGALASLLYMFLGYTYVVAYCSKSGEILHQLTDFPVSFCGFIFTFSFTILVCVGGTRATDQVNQWLTASMIGLLVAIETFALLFGGWSVFEAGGGDWGKVPATLPVMVFALVYHDLTPVLCAYLEGDLARIRVSVILGSVVPLLTLLVWDAIALGLSNGADNVSDPVELLLSVRWDGVPFMVESFALLAVGTSLIGTLLSFSEFFKEQLNSIALDFPTKQLVVVEKPSSFYSVNGWWEKNKTSITATAMVVVPSLLVSNALPDAFSAATDFAGGYCMTVLYGVLPSAMAWAMKQKKQGEETEQTALSKSYPAIFGVGLFSCGIVLQQILQDFSFVQP
ncbi:tyrosine-specific transport protein-like [Salvia divinorum]|uniref:Tyrosine-specific transport protein-like n=1 Tax=Salvia divinorum TaxID=28513 RepID=A0ABD1GHF3_SALDI